MKITIWDFITIFLLLITVIIGIWVAQVFIDPQTSLNPLPPPTLPALLDLPSPTATQRSMPSTWTPESKQGAEVVTRTLKPSSTVQFTATSIFVNTFTNTPTPTNTPTNTPTVTNTPTITNTPLPTKTFTITPDYTSTALSKNATHIAETEAAVP
ncbi:MAG: hypothetical protein MUO76_07180 [Anaerolineaceae bacterium]|nr:hypothetical protein [Anaerolineaceae bacterium]